MFSKNFKSVAATNQSGAMETGNHVCCAKCKHFKTAMDDRDHFTCATRSASKNEANPKSLMSRGNLLMVRIWMLAVCLTTAVQNSCTEPDVPVTSIELNHTNLSLVIGQSQTLTVVKVFPENATDKSVRWTSSNTFVAGVESNGTVTAITAGTTDITATVGGVTATCRVNVSNPVVPVASISLDRTTLTLEIGQTYPLTATVKPDNATNKTVSWSSSNTSVVTVDNSGKVTARSAGSANITAAAGSSYVGCTVTVTASIVAVQSITLDQTSLDLFTGYIDRNPYERGYAGGILTATVKPDNATNKTVTWSSSNPSVAEVRLTGSPIFPYIYGYSKGTAIITAQAGDKTATCTVNVLDITLDKREMELVVGEEYALKATTYPGGQPVTFTNSNTGRATVEDDGWGQGKIIAKTSGTLTVNATYNGQTTSCNVTIYDVPLSGVTIDGVTWAAFNVNAPGNFTEKFSDRGMYYTWNSKTGYSDYQVANTFTAGTSWSSENDPSPSGWRIPTLNEAESMLSKIINYDIIYSGTTPFGTAKGRSTIINGQPCVVMKFENNQHLVFPSQRPQSALSPSFWYWTSTPYGNNDAYIYLHNIDRRVYPMSRKYAIQIRCVKK